MSTPNLTVITSTCRRPQLLALCLDQFRRQQFAGFTAEHLVVADGPDPDAAWLAGRFGARYLELSAAAGQWGAAAKDAGIQAAKGDCVCFWDDDNLYEPQALAALHRAVQGVEIGVVQTQYRFRRRQGAAVIPRRWAGQFIPGDIDAMCVCVCRSLACREAWAAPAEPGTYCTDSDWLMRLSRYQPRIHFQREVIGWHL